MKCPYCAEEIKAEATVCRYCGRDLAFFKPVVRRLSLLEEQMAEISSALDVLRAEVGFLKSENRSVPPPQRQAVEEISLLRLALIVLFPALVSIGIFWFKITQLTFVALFIPFPFGLWVGVRWRGSHPKMYALLGLAVGVIEMATFLIVLALRNELKPAQDALSLFLMFVIGASTLFLAGGLFGDLINAIRFPGRQKEPKLARRIAKDVSRSRDEPNKTLILLVQALGPSLVGLVGTIVSVVGAFLTVSR